jgi:N-dimethylarginine dimethylaminohydrolase
MTSAETFKVYQNGKLPFLINELKRREEPLGVLMCSPEFFDILDVKNIHMEGQENCLNKDLAKIQWIELKATYEDLMLENIVNEVKVIQGAKGCEDMVFCANQTFPWVNESNEKVVFMSKMRHESRQKEVPFFEQFFQSLGYQTKQFLETPLFEGMGDTIPHIGKKLLYGGYGHRSDVSAYLELAEKLSVPIIALELINDNFYHLDTCFVPLSENQVMVCKEAFTAEGLSLIEQCFEQVFLIPIEEAIETFCLNAHVIFHSDPSKRVAILQKGSTVAKSVLQKCGYRVIEVQTSEFMKSGGSVFCMKMMYY